ncbi:MAG: efflux RND transporter periplasmic adaptor subunit, partial [Treponema sp.]|nr:efflux RND transporter periplasmic adaptor subunit [Treponema sp.]
MRKTVPAVAICIIAAFSISSCKKKEAAAPVAEEEEEVIYAVNSYRISGGNLDEYLEFGGDVASVASVDVMPDQAGKLTRILVSI